MQREVLKYTTLDNRQYHVLQIKDLVSYPFNKEDLNNWVCCRQGEGIYHRKFRTLREALIEIEIRGNANIQKYLIFKEDIFKEYYIQMMERVDAFIDQKKSI